MVQLIGQAKHSRPRANSWNFGLCSPYPQSGSIRSISRHEALEPTEGFEGQRSPEVCVSLASTRRLLVLRLKQSHEGEGAARRNVTIHVVIGHAAKSVALNESGR